MAAVARRCLTCRMLGPWGRGGRCPDCSSVEKRRREADPRRRAIKGARYDRMHRRIREYWTPVVHMGACLCARCHEPIEPGTPWDVDHLPDGTSQPSHASCNRRAITRTVA